MSENIVVIGSSHAAAQLAASLRQEGWAGAISVIGSELFPPYHRPPLSKAALSREKGDTELLIRPHDYYTRNNIDLFLGSEVIKIDRDRKRVILESGDEVPYTKLALTTGAKVRKVQIPGIELGGVCYLRDISDAHQVRKYIGNGKSAVVIGGGYIGLEAAASMRKMGMEVNVLEAQSRILARVTSPEISSFYTRVHREEGTNILTDVSIEKIEGEGASLVLG